MRRKGILKHIDFLIIDVISIFVSFFIARLLKFNYFKLDELYKSVLIYEILICISLAFIYEPYKDILKRKSTNLTFYTLIFDLLQFGLLTIILFVLKITGQVSRIFLSTEYVIYFLLSIVVKLIWRVVIKKIADISTLYGNKSLLIVTKKKNIDSILETIKNHNYNNYRITGLCVLDAKLKGKKYGDYKVLCNKEDLLSYASVNWVDEVYFDMPYSSIPKDIINDLSLAGITIHIRINKIQTIENRDQKVGKFFNNSVITSSIKERANKQIILKKLMDIVGSIIGCAITILLTIIIGPIIYIKSPGPIFYKQERIGLNGKHFYMYKFRSMVTNAEAKLKEVMKYNRVSSDLMFKMENDPRIIPGIGNFIRKTSLDEFPQFFNVLKGDMSLVGTRPPTINEFEQYKVNHRIRMSTKPGITGMWQVSGRNQITDFNKVVELDSYYINNWSLSLDVSILFKTVILIIARKSKQEAM